MKLNLKKAFKSILRWGESPDKNSDGPVSMVLLLRESRFRTLDQLRSAAEKAFGTSFAGGKESQHCVIEADIFTLMKAGPHMLSFLNSTKPYGEAEFPQKFGSSMPKASQRQAWAEHNAWTAVDYVKGSAAGSVAAHCRLTSCRCLTQDCASRQMGANAELTSLRLPLCQQSLPN